MADHCRGTMNVVAGMSSQQSQEVQTQPSSENKPSTSGSSSQGAQRPRQWGCVNGVNLLLPPSVSMSKDSFTFGRKEKCDFTFLEVEHQIRMEVYHQISQRHFTIHKCMDSVFLEDHSFNGTYVNGVRVSSDCPGGKRQVLLQSEDRIAVVDARGPCFEYYLFNKGNKLEDALPAALTSRFHVVSLLGSGGSATVYLAKDKHTFKKFALKTIKKCCEDVGMNSVAYIENEVKILKSIEHSTIVGVENVFDTKEYTIIVMEFMAGGSLADRLRVEKENRFSESICRMFAYQLLLALEYLHLKNIIHRDIKPENILAVSRNDNDYRVKLADFGLSKFVSQSRVAVTECGTKKFAAPEVLNSARKAYTSKVDVWSLGATIYLCISGKAFDQQGTNFTGGFWKKISANAEDCIKRMLRVNPEKRPTARELLDCSWFKETKFEKIKSKLPSPIHQNPGNRFPLDVLAKKRPNTEWQLSQDGCRAEKRSSQYANQSDPNSSSANMHQIKMFKLPATSANESSGSRNRQSLDLDPKISEH